MCKIIYFFYIKLKPCMALLDLANETFPHMLARVLYYRKMCNRNHVKH